MKQKYILGSVILFSLGSLILNGLITYFILKSWSSQLFSLDCISLKSNSLMGVSMYPAMVITILFSFVSFIFLKRIAGMKEIVAFKQLQTLDYWPDVFVMSLRNAIFAFGLILILVSLGINRLGDVELNTMPASIIGGFFALVLTGITLYATFDSLLSKKS